MKKSIFFLLKLCISCVLAVAILSAWCLVYYNPPIAIPQPNHYTNNRYQPNSWWINMKEGFGWGSINDLGYNNKENYDPSLKTIAFIGSSQFQAIQVPQNKNMVSLTQELLQSDENPDNDYQCLNLGVSGHFFNINASNYQYFVEQFDNVDYVIMEVMSFNYSADELDKILEGGYHSELKERNVLYKTAQKIPYFRLLAKQWQEINSKETDSKETKQLLEGESRYEKVDSIIKNLVTLSNEHGIKLIILYHQNFKVGLDNQISFNNDEETERYLFKSCEANNVPIINMNQPMVDYYQTYQKFSYGFANSTIGTGHLNTVGHELIAQSVYNEIVKQMGNN